jgi:hypothetical protein
MNDDNDDDGDDNIGNNSNDNKIIKRRQIIQNVLNYPM